MLLLDSAAKPVQIEEIEGPETKGKRRIIAAAERLFGQTGFSGTSLQDIAAAAGNANKYAVQYHFGSKDGLIEAIVALRMRWIDRRRQELLMRAEALDLTRNPKALLEALCLPVAEQVDERGRHSFARFRLQYYTRPEYDRFGNELFIAAGGPTAKATHLLTEVSRLTADDLHERLYLLGFVLLGALVDRDNRIVHARGDPTIERVVYDTISIIAAALS